MVMTLSLVPCLLKLVFYSVVVKSQLLQGSAYTRVLCRSSSVGPVSQRDFLQLPAGSLPASLVEVASVP